MSKLRAKHCWGRPKGEWERAPAEGVLFAEPPRAVPEGSQQSETRQGKAVKRHQKGTEKGSGQAKGEGRAVLRRRDPRLRRAGLGGEVADLHVVDVGADARIVDPAHEGVG